MSRIELNDLATSGYRKLAAYYLRTNLRIRRGLELRMENIVGWWASLLLAVSIVKVAFAPAPPASLPEALAMALPFLALGAAPIIGYRLAAGAFPRGHLMDQPAVRLAVYGSWRQAGTDDLRRSQLVGPTGFLVSLIVGLLINVPFRSLKFLAIIPAVGPADPHWAQTLVAGFTVQAAVMNFLYMVCFVMALRRIPLFPRMLVVVWSLDLASQFVLAHVMGGAGLPASLAQPLIDSLSDNLTHVLIAAAIWLPYLLVSDQVNLVYRFRLRDRR